MAGGTMTMLFGRVLRTWLSSLRDRAAARLAASRFNPSRELPRELTDNRDWLAKQLSARATIHRAGNGIIYSLNDAAIDELAAEALRK
jgi:hypothetical protein